MSNIVKLTQLLPSPSYAFLLQIDEAKILLDVGWDSSLNLEALSSIREVAKSVDLVLLSHAKINHIGGYAYAATNLGLTCRTLSTLPVQALGRLATLDLFESIAPREPPCSVDQVQRAFEGIQTIRYMQPVTLLDDITFTAYAAGHTVGGTIWKISKESDNIVYLVEFNHKTERLLDGSAILSKTGGIIDPLARASLVISDVSNALRTHPPRKKREAQLFDCIKDTIAAGGNVLIPIDTSARMLVLAHLLEHHWRQYYHQTVPLVILSHQSHKTLQYAKSMLEWFGENIVLAFSNAKEHPLEFKYLRLCTKRAQFETLKGPKVVLASLEDCETGFSRRLFLTWSPDSRNTIVLTSRGRPGSILRKLYNYAGRPLDDHYQQFPLDLNVPIHKKVPLRGDDLMEHLRRERERRAAEERRKAMAEELASPNDDDEEEDLEDDENELANEPTAEEVDVWRTNFDVYLKDTANKPMFFKRQFQTYTLFPYLEPRRKYDEYGEVIDPDQYMTEYDRLSLAQQQQPLQMKRPQQDEINTEPEADRDSDDDAYLLSGEKASKKNEDANAITKVVTSNKRFPVRCNVRYIDFEGLADGRSICTVIPQMQPKKVVAVNGTQKEAAVLRDALDSQEMNTEFHTASVNTTLNLSSTSHIYQIRLTDRLLSSLRKCSLGEYELAYVSGIVQKKRDGTVLDFSEGIPGSHAPLLVGDVKLAELRLRLDQMGYKTQLGKGGVMVIYKSEVSNPIAIVRKNMEGNLMVEGSGLHKDYFKLRDLVYSQLVSL